MHETRLTILTNGLNYSQLAPHTPHTSWLHTLMNIQQIEALNTEINTFYFLIALIFETILSVALLHTSTLRESVEWVGLRSVFFGLVVISLGRHN